MALSDFGTVNGRTQLDSEGNTTVVIDSTATWQVVPSTWETWLNYSQGNDPILYWLTEPITFDVADYFNITSNIEAVGSVEYTVWVSTTGAFEGEESETVINENDTGVTGFFGKYVIIGLKITEDPTAGAVELRVFNWKASTRTLSLQFNNYLSSGLPGSVSSRLVYLPRVVSQVTNVIVSPQRQEGYFVADYITPVTASFTNCSGIGFPTAPDYSILDPGWEGFGDPLPEGYETWAPHISYVNALYAWNLENCDITYTGDATDLYIEESQMLLSAVTTKSSDHFGVAFSTVTGTYTDVIFDAIAHVLPEQYADGANLSVR